MTSDNMEVPEIRVKTAYNGEVLITYINPNITLEQLSEEIRDMCKFTLDQAFTIKWVDEEGDPCTISNQLELDEAIRLYEVNKDTEIVIHGEWFQIQLYFRNMLELLLKDTLGLIRLLVV